MPKDQTVLIYKNEGETPLECLQRFRLEKPEYQQAILSYAGRLDPMAEGLLLVLVNEANKEREKYLGLDKEYEIEILLGVSTDTGDVLGKIKPPTRGLVTPLSGGIFASAFSPDKGVGGFFSSFLGKQTAPYPSYSSKPIKGKPLFEWAREGRLDEIEIPQKEFEIYSIEENKLIYLISKNDLLKTVKERMEKVKGDFRQEEIIKSWNDQLVNNSVENFFIFSLKVCCSSGAYMRTLAENMALKLGTTGIAWKIKRTKIGDLV